MYTKFLISTALLKLKIKIKLFYIICFQLYTNMKNMSYIFYYFLYVSLCTAFSFHLRGAITMHSDVHSGTEHAHMLLDCFSPSERNPDHGCCMQPWHHARIAFKLNRLKDPLASASRLPWEQYQICVSFSIFPLSSRGISISRWATSYLAFAVRATPHKRLC